MSKTTAKTFVKSLMMRALRIEEAIRKEQRKRWPNGIKLLQLKKLRLAVKDRLYRLSQRTRAQGPRRLHAQQDARG